MTLDEFSCLDETHQAGILIDRGIFIAERHYKNFDIFLYEVDNFYVEIYHNLNFNAMQGMRCFKDADALEPYLEEIDISCLYQC
jgi:hypothetical protein